MATVYKKWFYCTLQGQGKQDSICKIQCGECAPKYPSPMDIVIRDDSEQLNENKEQ